MTDTVMNMASDDEVVDRTVQIIRDLKPNLLFSCFDEPDGVGHKIGHDTPEYYDQMTKNDMHLAKILQAVKDACIENETLIMIMSDHGGIGKGHGAKTMAEMQTPLIFWGKSVKQQPEMQQSIMMYDIGATIAWIFDLKFPQVWTGRQVKEAFK
jgi:predicted AlkP superfamily pyrophosphatase or phosphodiesterase